MYVKLDSSNIYPNIFKCSPFLALCDKGSVRICPAGDVECVTSSDLDYLVDDQLRVGRVEFCLGGRYGTICDNTWDYEDASVLCRQLGFSPHGKIIAQSKFIMLT